MVQWWIGNVLRCGRAAGGHRAAEPGARRGGTDRAATDDILAGGVALVGQLDGVPGALATTSSTVDDIATGAVRYAGSVAKLLG
jgi:hypothetical protein